MPGFDCIERAGPCIRGPHADSRHSDRCANCPTDRLPDADAALFVGLAPAYTAFKQMEPQAGSLLHVQDAYSGADAWVSASDVGPIDTPGLVGAPGRWWGISYVDGANLRSAPSTRADTL